jgi:inner membrane protein
MNAWIFMPPMYTGVFDLCAMDSLSQIVLGAAVGEAVLGKKLGNRAMVWGAVAGTLPDMDVLGQFFLNELDNLAFHRGISHSLTATVFGSLFFGWRPGFSR